MSMKIMLVAMLVMLLTSCGTKAKQAAGLNTAWQIGTNEKMQLIRTILLPNVSGRIDHLSVDLQGKRLFIAALGNNSVEVLDLKTGKVIHSISGFSEPQGVLFLPVLNRLFVMNGGNGLCQIFDASSFAEVSRVALAGDADNVRYDNNSGSVVVGYADGGLSFINPASGQVVTDIKLDGHPESFQLEATGSKVFANIPGANEIAIVDREQKKVIATWSMTTALANFPMALDESQHRLFVGSRLPAKLSVLDTETGKLIASLKSVGDVDDIFYDAKHKLIFLIGGEGYIDIFSQKDVDHYQILSRVPTAAGARTGLWVPELNRLYVAVPRRGNQNAEIRVYELQP